MTVTVCTQQQFLAVLIYFCPFLRSTCFLPPRVTGTLKLMNSSEQLLWSVQVDHQLFALQKLDVTVSLCDRPTLMDAFNF